MVPLVDKFAGRPMTDLNPGVGGNILPNCGMILTEMGLLNDVTPDFISAIDLQPLYIYQWKSKGYIDNRWIDRWVYR